MVKDTMVDVSNLVTVQEAADLVGKTRMTIYKSLKDRPEGELEFRRIGNSIMIPKDALIRYALSKGWIELEVES